ncbi:sigma-54-dependent transcriptional regulator [Piscinibacter terrae]|uniref:Sigma-54-dependent Fis family transcriptional regulator n=1 Tax=Piscinibacter terrae TaxID=2496871 RepID=A0A3N7HPZ8_9BURK|nr:sigma-54 dependent transcriptional regulator [Albitalea terrae]RQP22831.1 sigma-54-dependent Fis family transcriptional regulator [Albitalea terrae]
MPHALIVDDELDVVEWMAEVARSEGYTVVTADSLRAARAQLVRQTPDVLLTDLQLPDGRGTDLVRDLEAPAQTEVVVITGHASVDSAIEAVRIGASDYLIKPVDVERLRAILRRQPQAAELKSEIGELREELRRAGRFGHMVGDSPPMQALYDKIARVAPTAATVLLTGESGTGKEVAARTIHELSRRRKFPFLAINCGAISPNLIESELFGHEKGSFTGADRQHRGFFEQAAGGTIFLDEVTEMPPDLQVKLLRVLETSTFVRVGTTEPVSTDVRVIAATNRSPERAVAEGRFREDLYHRLNVFPIALPPLRERGSDIEMLAQQFLRELNKVEGTNKAFSPEALARLYELTWPGNVRELKNYVQRAYILADSVVEGVDTSSQPPLAAEDQSGLVVVRVGTPLEEVERRVTMATLESCGRVKRTAARILGISLKTLYNRLEAYAAKDRARELEESGPMPLVEEHEIPSTVGRGPPSGQFRRH